MGSIIAYIAHTPSITPFGNPVTPSNSVSGHSFVRQRFFLYSILFLFFTSTSTSSPSIHSIRWFAFFESRISPTILQPPPIHYPNLIPHAKCATKSSNATRSASVSTSNTRSIHALLMDSAAMQYRKRPSWLGMPVTDTRDAGYMLFRLVRGGGLILGMGVGI